ncbi:MAG: glucan biosynthesis protein, partial [Bosea sp. (in: a-proteobacteria)]|nr:glucan biosynthesis protein [Bosea sp. (in: a-proteobacteria)]
MRPDPDMRPAGPGEAAAGVKAGGLPSRRLMLGLLGSAGILATLPARGQAPTSAPEPSFGYADVVERARQLGRNAFDADAAKIPAELSQLTYDSYREIRFRRDRAFWREGGSDFRLLPFHVGFLHNKPVQLHTVANGVAMPIPFTTALFEYGKVPVLKGLSPSLGFAGFAVTTNLNDPRVQ